MRKRFKKTYKEKGGLNGMCKYCEKGCDIKDIDYMPIGKILNNKLIITNKHNKLGESEIKIIFCPICGVRLR